MLQLEELDPGHNRKAEQCLEFWSHNRASSGNIVLGLWDKIRSQPSFLESSAAIYDYTTLALAENGMPSEAQSVFEDFLNKDFTYQPQNNRHVPHPYHLNAILHSYARQRQPRQAEKLLKECFQNPRQWIKPNVYSVTSVLDAWSRVGDGKRAQEFLEWVESRGVVDLNTAAYNAVLAAWSRSKEPDSVTMATSLLQRMPVPADEVSWSSVLVAGASKAPEVAEDMLWNALRRGEPVNAICFNVVLHAWGKARKAKRAEKLLRDWIHHVTEHEIPNDLRPGLSSFNAVLHSLATSGKNGQQAQDLLEEMKTIGIEPDGISYNSVIDAWAREGNGPRACAVLDESTHSDDKQRRIAFNTVIKAWANSCHNDGSNDDVIFEARAIIERMESSGVSPDVITFNALLKAMAAVGGVESAKEATSLLDHMERIQIPPDIVSYSTIIAAWAKCGDKSGGERAHQILRRMKSNSVHPNVVSYNSVIHAFSKQGDTASAPKAESILKEMKSSDSQPDLMTYCLLLSCWSNSRHTHKARRARKILDEMIIKHKDLATSKNANDLLRNAHTMVLSACAYVPRQAETHIREEALEIAIRTFQATPKPNHTTYVSYFQALYHLMNHVPSRHRFIQEAFAQYRSKETHVHEAVLRRLKKVTPPQVHKRILKGMQAVPPEQTPPH